MRPLSWVVVWKIEHEVTRALLGLAVKVLRDLALDAIGTVLIAAVACPLLRGFEVVRDFTGAFEGPARILVRSADHDLVVSAHHHGDFGIPDVSYPLLEGR